MQCVYEKWFDDDRANTAERLRSQKVNAQYKGVVIRNGKKVVK